MLLEIQQNYIGGLKEQLNKFNFKLKEVVVSTMNYGLGHYGAAAMAQDTRTQGR